MDLRGSVCIAVLLLWSSTLACAAADVPRAGNDKAPAQTLESLEKEFNKLKPELYRLKNLTQEQDSQKQSAKGQDTPRKPVKVIYHGNASSRIYHAPGCRYYHHKKCTANFQSREEAAKAGYRPHSECVKATPPVPPMDEEAKSRFSEDQEVKRTGSLQQFSEKLEKVPLWFDPHKQIIIDVERYDGLIAKLAQLELERRRLSEQVKLLEGKRGQVPDDQRSWWRRLLGM